MATGIHANGTLSRVALIVLLLLHNVVAFAPPRQRHGSCLTTLYMAKKKKKKKGPPKLSYAERLQLQREKKAKEQGLDAPPPVAIASGQKDESTKELAKEMIAAQRKSVDMLTFVRERVEGMPVAPIMESLKKDGYVVVDDFLASDDAVAQLQGEGLALFEKEMMSVDLSRLGSGEYLCAVAGGDEQYAVCPRAIEMVVCVTKHVPECLPEFDLDAGNCMANMRTFDRNSKQASLSLLEGGELPPQPFGIVATEENDARKVTLLYYMTDTNWTDGGGIVIEQGERLISAKRDRLVIMMSDSCRYRSEYFEGSDGLQRASCLELHLITKPKEIVE